MGKLVMQEPAGQPSLALLLLAGDNRLHHTIDRTHHHTLRLIIKTRTFRTTDNINLIPVLPHSNSLVRALRHANITIDAILGNQKRHIRFIPTETRQKNTTNLPSGESCFSARFLQTEKQTLIHRRQEGQFHGQSSRK